jgi:hypothetical protein
MIAEMAGPEPGSGTSAPTVWRKLLDFIEHPAMLSALFGIGALVGALVFTPFFVFCAVSALFAFHRSGVVAGRSWKTQAVTYIVLIVILSGRILPLSVSG